MRGSFGGALALVAAAFLAVSVPATTASAGEACGDFSFDFNEGCEDGNTVEGDGCTNCLVDLGYPCNTTNGDALVGDASCGSGLCDDTEDPPTCEAQLVCGNGALEPGEGCDDGDSANADGCNSDCLVEDGSPCNLGDNAGLFGDASCESGNCDETAEPSAVCAAAVPTTTTSTTTSTSTTTLPETTTTTDTTTTSTSTTEEPITGACCYGGGCQDVTVGYCIVELLGGYQGDGTSCDDPGVCSDCGNGCLNPGEDCDDGDTNDGDGCSSKCVEEACFTCTEAQLSDDRAALCVGPSQCVADEVCGNCGNGEVEFGEQCDDGNTQAVDCCNANCQFVTGGASCSDGNFCDGPETCDGSGNCNDGADPTCPNGGNECKVGYCDSKANACVLLNAEDGTLCDDAGACSVGNGGTCEDGVCTGAATTLSPTCRWIIVGGSTGGDVRVRTGPGSTVDADMCGDTARIGGITTDDIVVTAATGEGIRFYGPPEVAGDIVTGGATVRSNLYLAIPGTTLKFLDTASTQLKAPSGVVTTTGLHPLVNVCSDDQTILANAVPVLEVMGDPDMEEGGGNGLKVGIGSGYVIDVTGDGLAVIDMNGLKVAHGATLTLKGGASDVAMLRINSGRLKIGYGASIVLDGLVPENVLIYSDGTRCRVSPGVTGAGTVFCPAAGRFIIGAGVEWSGTFLGAAREVRVRSNAALTHVPFTGF